MSSALPFAGGTYKYASLGLGRFFGFIAGWNYIIAIVCVSAAEAFAFSFYFKTMFSDFGINIPISDTITEFVVVMHKLYSICEKPVIPIRRGIIGFLMFLGE